MTVAYVRMLSVGSVAPRPSSVTVYPWARRYWASARPWCAESGLKPSAVVADCGNHHTPPSWVGSTSTEFGRTAGQRPVAGEVNVVIGAPTGPAAGSELSGGSWVGVVMPPSQAISTAASRATVVCRLELR